MRKTSINQKSIILETILNKIQNIQFMMVRYLINLFLCLILALHNMKCFTRTQPQQLLYVSCMCTRLCHSQNIPISISHDTYYTTCYARINSQCGVQRVLVRIYPQMIEASLGACCIQLFISSAHNIPKLFFHHNLRPPPFSNSSLDNSFHYIQVHYIWHNDQHMYLRLHILDITFNAGVL